MIDRYMKSVLNTRPKLTGNELRIILFVYLNPKSNVSEISRGTEISKSHTSEMCLKLFKKGIFKRDLNSSGNFKYPIYTINLKYQNGGKDENSC